MTTAKPNYRPFTRVIIAGILLLLCQALFRDHVAAQTVVGGDINMTLVDPGSPFMDIAPLTNSTQCNLRYSSGNRTRKVTVQATTANAHYSLTVNALNIPTVQDGVSQGPVELMNATTAVDFIRDILRWSGTTTCDLSYVATATYADGNSAENGGNTVVRVTYSIVNQ